MFSVASQDGLHRGLTNCRGTQIEQARARRLDGVTDTSGLVGGQVVHDDNNIAAGERGNQHLLDMGAQYVAVHGAVVDEGSGHAGRPERAGEGGGYPVAVRHTGPAALTAKRTAPQARHLGRQASFVDEDHLRGMEIGLCVEPGAPPPQDVGTVLLQGMCGLLFERPAVGALPVAQGTSPMRIERSPLKQKHSSTSHHNRVIEPQTCSRPEETTQREDHAIGTARHRCGHYP